MSTEYLDSNGLTTLWTQIRAADAAVLTSANNDRTIIETYNLPSLTASSSTSYDILTSKSAVTIAQGGTGATSASAARTNLGLGTMATEAASDYLPISGKAVGIKTTQTAGYETDGYGNFQHQRTTNIDTWAIKTNSGTSSFYVNYETGSATSNGTVAASLLKTYDSSGYPGVGFATSAAVGLYGIINFDTVTNHRFYFTQRYSAGATYAEIYTLPPATTTMSANAWYDILTTKSAVTIAQGGTGATTAANARTNLAVLGTAGGTMTGTITHKHSSWDVTSPPSSDSSWDIHYVTDKNDKGITFHRIWNKTTNGVMGYEFGVRRQGSSAGTTTFWNTITLDVAADGTRSVSVSDAAAWRTALGLGSIATASTSDYIPTANYTGNYKIYSNSNEITSLYILNSSGSSRTNIFTYTNSNTTNQLRFREWTNGTSYWEQYALPEPTASSSTNSQTYSILTSKSAVTVAQGGTGATTFTSGDALIGNGTGAITTRGITNLTAKGYIPYSSTNLITVNALAFWDGSYNSSGSSNISHVGIITSGTWQGTAIASAYIGSHTHSYLPLSGGTITGQLIVQGSSDSIYAVHGVACADYEDSYFKKRMNAAAFLVGGHTTDDKFRGGLAMNSTNNRVYFRAHKTSGNARGDIFQFPAPTNTSTSSDVTYFIPIMQYGYAAANTSTNITLNRTGTWLMITGHNSTAGSNELYIVRTGANVFRVSGGTSSTMTSISISNATITLKSSNAINIYFIFLAHGTND